MIHKNSFDAGAITTSSGVYQGSGTYTWDITALNARFRLSRSGRQHGHSPVCFCRGGPKSVFLRVEVDESTRRGWCADRMTTENRTMVHGANG